MTLRWPRRTFHEGRSRPLWPSDACDSGILRKTDSSTQSRRRLGKVRHALIICQAIFHISLNSLGTAEKGQTGPPDPSGNSKSLADRQKRIRVPALDSPHQRQFFRRSANVGTTSASAAPLRENHWQCSPAFRPTKPHHHSNKLAAKARRPVS